jgi:hypothetical protein
MAKPWPAVAIRVEVAGSVQEGDDDNVAVSASPRFSALGIGLTR